MQNKNDIKTISQSSSDHKDAADKNGGGWAITRWMKEKMRRGKTQQQQPPKNDAAAQSADKNKGPGGVQRLKDRLAGIVQGGKDLVSSKTTAKKKVQSYDKPSHHPGMNSVNSGSQFQLIGPDANEISLRFYHLSKHQDKIYFRPDYGTDETEGDDDGPDEFIRIADVREIRPGWQTDQFLEAARAQREQYGRDDAILHQDRCFSIHYSAGMSDSLQAPDAETARQWIAVVEPLVHQRQIEDRQSRHDPIFWLRLFYKNTTAKSRSGGLTFERCQRLFLNKMDVRIEKVKNVEAMFHQAGSGRKVLSEDEFVRFFHLLGDWAVFDKLFAGIAKGQPSITPEQLSEFLVNVQGMAGMDAEQAELLIERFGCDKMEGFRTLMTSELFDIRREEHRRINQDMSRPLTHYWIKSATSSSASADKEFLLAGSHHPIEGYVRAEDCATVELDLWDGPDGEPVVRHAGKMTKILAKDVLVRDILPFVFLRDDYPVIVSVKDRMSDGQRKIFLHDWQRTFGASSLNGDKMAAATTSPDHLKREVILIRRNDVMDVSESQVRTALGQDGPCSSIGCLGTKEAVYDTPEALMESTAKQLTRFVPDRNICGRLMRERVDPISWMNVGCQMTALDPKTKGKRLAFYAGRFRSNGECSYALKPDSLIDPAAESKIPSKKLVIRVISGHQLPAGPNERLVVSATLACPEYDETIKETTKRVRRGDGLSHQWGDELTFEKIEQPELAVILFRVERALMPNCCYKSIGYFALPVMSLGEGYRSIALQDKNLAPISLANLLVHVKLEDL